ncbi:PilN domain-containing protein [Neisseriaceae bacterium TC5R-5]|nr:PilN domain-containing protein [Neisseriaceae bacterium TC5R-5]
MIRINLLPHREQKKAAHRLRFQVLLGLSLASAIAIIVLSYFFIIHRQSQQELRNQFLQGEVAKLDRQIKDIGTLKKQRDELLMHKELVERLEEDRNEATHVLDQLTRQTPDGVYLSSFKQTGNQFTLSGYAVSGGKVSSYMRNLAQSDTFTAPVLVEVKASIVNNQRVNEFTLTTALHEKPHPDITRISGQAHAASQAITGNKP